MKKVLIFMLLCLILTGCSIDIENKAGDVIDIFHMRKVDPNEGTCSLSEVFSYDVSDNIKYMVDWQYSGTLKTPNGTTVEEQSDGYTLMSLSNGLQHIMGYINKDMYKTSESCKMDYYMDLLSQVYTVDGSESSYLDIQCTDDFAVLYDSLREQRFKLEESGYSCKMIISDLHSSLLSRIFRESLAESTDIVVNVLVVSGDEPKIILSQDDLQCGDTYVEHLFVSYKLIDADLDNFTINPTYEQVRSESEETTDEVQDLYNDGYKFNSRFENHVLGENKLGYGDYIYDGSCIVDYTKQVGYSLYTDIESEIEECNIVKFGDIVQCFTNENSSYNFKPYNMDVRKVESTSELESIVKQSGIEHPEGTELRAFKVFYTIPAMTNIVYYNMSPVWAYRVGKDYQRVYCLTDLTCDCTLKLAQGCQVVKYYVYFIEEGVQDELLVAQVYDLNYDKGFLFWR